MESSVFSSELRREGAQRHDHLRLDDVDLAEQELLARLHFVRFRIAVLRRPALDHVGDVDVFPLQADRLDDLRQLLPGAADKRDALDIFVAAWRLAYKHQIGVRVADAEHDLLASQLAELAPRAVADIRANGREGRLSPAPHGTGSPVPLDSRCALLFAPSLRSPHRILAKPGDAKLAVELQMFGQLIDE